MFKKLKKVLKTLLGALAEEKAGKKSNAQAVRTPRDKERGRDKDRKRKTSRPEARGGEFSPSAGAGEKMARPRKEKSKPVNAGRADVPVTLPPPVKPEKLEDVPVCEGKTRFLDLQLHPDVEFGIQHARFQYCTPIQEMAIKPLLEGRDLAGKAQTGTGKTAAFLLAGFDHLLKNPISVERRNGDVRMLVLAPTRELAMQIHKDAESLGIFTGLAMTCLFGGMDYEKQRRSLDRPLDLVIATPGRLIDYLRNGCINLHKVEILVIDEADRMLDMGFIPDVKRIVSQLPRKGERQTMLFSATLEEHILPLTSSWLADPVVLESEPEHMVGDNIEQVFYSVSRDEKLALILYLLRTEPYDRILIFGNRKDVNLRLQYDLARYGYEVPVLSGDIPQDKRIRVLERFRNADDKIVIATDVAARGIHVDDVSLVINYDLPERAEDYVHRIGRTGRAGHSGKAISFLCEYGAYYLPAIEDLLKVRFDSIQPTDEMMKLPPPVPGAKLPVRKIDENRGHGGFHRGGSRGGSSRFGGRRR